MATLSCVQGTGVIKLLAEYAESSLIETVVMEVTHMDQAKGAMPLALGIRDSNIEIKVKVKQDKDEEKVTLQFGT